MNASGRVSNLETKDGVGKNDKPYRLYRLEVGGQWYSTFDEAAGNYRPGDEVSFIYEEKPNPNGQYPYRNITAFTESATDVSDEETEHIQRGGLPDAPLRDATRVSIERQTSLKASVDLAVAYISKTDDKGQPETPNYEFIILKAEQFYNWLSQTPQDTRTDDERAVDALGADDDEHHPADR
jgi:hypothetical protein